MISIISPVHNEEEIILDFYIELKNNLSVFPHEIIFINDGSTDKSLKVLKKIESKDPNVRIFSFKKNKGQQESILKGLTLAEGSAILVLDSDLQDPPQYISSFIRKWEEGTKIVFGRRKKRKDSIFKKITAYLFYRFLKLITFNNTYTDCGDFYLLDKEVVTFITALKGKKIFIRGILGASDFKKSFVEVERRGREKGKTSYSFFKMINLAFWGSLSVLKFLYFKKHHEK